jgi:hypothetical protein
MSAADAGDDEQRDPRDVRRHLNIAAPFALSTLVRDAAFSRCPIDDSGPCEINLGVQS